MITWYSSVSGVLGPPGVWLQLRMRLNYRSQRILEAPAVSDHVPAHPTQLESMILTHPTSPIAQQRSLRSRRGRRSVCTSRSSPGCRYDTCSTGLICTSPICRTEGTGDISPLSRVTAAVLSSRRLPAREGGHLRRT